MSRIMLFPAADWTTHLEVATGLDGARLYHADVFRSGEWMCRIALAGTFANHAEAEEALRVRLESWLADYEVRPNPNESGFAVL